MSQLRFLADAMLGTLAKKLRLLGIDTAYAGDLNDSELKYLVRSQGRILLTKDKVLARELGGQVWLVKGASWQEELSSIAEKLSTVSCQLQPFSLCLDCNDTLLAIGPSQAEGKVPPYILKSRTRFSSCASCGKVFWEGSHRKRMEEEVEWMEKILKD